MTKKSFLSCIMLSNVATVSFNPLLLDLIIEEKYKKESSRYFVIFHQKWKRMVDNVSNLYKLTITNILLKKVLA
jgi:hypothetical protein